MQESFREPEYLSNNTECKPRRESMVNTQFPLRQEAAPIRPSAQGAQTPMWEGSASEGRTMDEIPMSPLSAKPNIAGW